jgi:hypothetical protein
MKIVVGLNVLFTVKAAIFCSDYQRFQMRSSNNVFLNRPNLHIREKNRQNYKFHNYMYIKGVGLGNPKFSHRSIFF